MEEATVHRFALQVAHRSRVRIRKDRLGTVIANHLLKPGGDFAKRLVPTHRFEFPAALWSYSTQRMRQPVMMVGTLDVPIDLCAEKTLSYWMIGVALNANGAAILHSRDHRARVRTVVWTRAADSSAIDQREGSGSHCPSNILRGRRGTLCPASRSKQHPAWYAPDRRARP